MSVLKSFLSNASPAHPGFSNLVEIDSRSKSLAIHLGRRKELDEVFLARFREELGKIMEAGDFEEVLFDLEGILVLPSSALGLMASICQGEAKVRVINASKPAREDFQMTGLYRMIEVEPTQKPPAK
jgi:anti-anti-sigma factor